MFEVIKDKCIGCCQCINDCPVDDIYLTDEKKAHIKNENCIKCGHCVAICPVEAVTTDTYDMDDVIPYEELTFDIAPDHLLNFIRFRRTTRHFQKKPVPKEILKKIIEAGRFTETSTNSQDVSYIVLEETLPEITDTIYEILKKKGEYLLANLTPEFAIYERYARLWVTMYDAYHADKIHNDRLFFHAPTVILVTAGNPINGALASSNMELMANACGLGVCFCGFALKAFEGSPELLEKIGIDEEKQVISCLVLGYPSVHYKRTTPRKKAEIKWC